MTIQAKADLGLLQHPGWSALTIITKSSLLDVAGVPNPPLVRTINNRNI